MKKIFVISFLAIAIWSCSHKTTPSQATTTTTTVTTTTATGDVAAGKDTYSAKCQQCHGLKDPGKFTTTQWAPILDNMARKANLDPTEKANVLAYVLANAKQG
jgi:trimethylamine-N-oxide reductase (cytochrome c)